MILNIVVIHWTKTVCNIRNIKLGFLDTNKGDAPRGKTHR